MLAHLRHQILNLTLFSLRHFHQQQMSLQALECLTDYDHLSPKSDHSPQNSEHISQT